MEIKQNHYLASSPLLHVLPCCPDTRGSQRAGEHLMWNVYGSVFQEQRKMEKGKECLLKRRKRPFWLWLGMGITVFGKQFGREIYSFPNIRVLPKFLNSYASWGHMTRSEKWAVIWKSHMLLLGLKGWRGSTCPGGLLFLFSGNPVVRCRRILGKSTGVWCTWWKKVALEIYQTCSRPWIAR